MTSKDAAFSKRLPVRRHRGSITESGNSTRFNWHLLCTAQRATTKIKMGGNLVRRVSVEVANHKWKYIHSEMGYVVHLVDKSSQ